MILLQCQSSEKLKLNSANGYVKMYDTIQNFSTNGVKRIYRTFYQKTPTIHNGIIQLKHAYHDNSYYLVTQEKNSDERVSIKIKDLNIFLNQTDYIINSNLNNITIALDSTEQTYIRKSLSFEKGIFFIHIYDTNKNILFDLSHRDLEVIKEAYKAYINE